MVPHIRLYETRIQHEAIKPLILGTDPNAIPKQYRLGRSIGGIWYRRLIPATFRQRILQV